MSGWDHPGSVRSLVLTAHGSADPRSAETTFAVAERIRQLRPGLDVRVAFCEKSTPGLADVLAELRRPAVVTPLLLASAYHARVDIPAMVAESGADVVQADTLGEDPRLTELLRTRLAALGVERHHTDTGVLVVAVGSSHAEANARTATVATGLAQSSRWTGVQIAYATGPQPSVADGIEALRRLGARRICLAPWFIAPGRITDRVTRIAAERGVEIAEPLGAHELVAATALDRFDQAVARRLAA